MAERLSDYDFKKASNITTTERRNYPWNEWFDGSIWRITWGVDFDTHPLMMERVIRTRATSRKIKLSIRHEGTPEQQFQHIVLQVHGAAKEAWKVVPMTKPEGDPNEQFAMADPVADTPVRPSKRPVRPKGVA